MDGVRARRLILVAAAVGLARAAELTLEEHDGKTQWTTRVLFKSVEDRDGLLRVRLRAGVVGEVPLERRGGQGEATCTMPSTTRARYVGRVTVASSESLTTVVSGCTAVTVPTPVPAFLTVSSGPLNVAATVFAWSTVTVQVLPLPLQPPPVNPANRRPTSAGSRATSTCSS